MKTIDHQSTRTMRASQEFGEREAWITTTHARFDHAYRPAQSTSFGLLIKAFVIVVALTVAAKYATPILKAKGWI